jgi:hypothetical protein
MAARLEAEMVSHHEELMKIMKAGQGKIEAMMEVCLEEMGATVLEDNGEKWEVVAVRQEVPSEEDEVETIGALQGRYG